MNNSPQVAGAPYISTGHLPPAPEVQTMVHEAHRLYDTDTAGRNSEVYPALAAMPPNLFGVCIADVTGNVFAAGDTDAPFTIMSVSKPLVFALVCEAIGPAAARAKIGANATGLPFNALASISLRPDGLTNPMVNPGAIATTSLVPGATAEGKWRFIHEGLSRFAGHALAINEDIYACASATNQHNRAIAQAMRDAGTLYDEPAQTVDLYTRQCSLEVTAKDLAVMAATLANGGVNPVTGARVIDATVCEPALAVMTTAGMYETSGDWLYDIGLPGKSGIGGGIITVSPGKGGLGTFAPRLDAAGNSVKGQLAAKYLSRRLGLSLFASACAVRAGIGPS
jgi:glutaminase